jgi:adenosine kinase
VYVGAVGKDDFAAQLRSATKKEGVRTEYMTVDTSTGKCGVLITGHHRSLVTDLGAANEYKLDHLQSPEIWKLVEGAKYYYVGGYHLTVCPPAIIELGKHAAEKNKVSPPFGHGG